MALKATEEPMLMSERRHVIMQVIMTLFSGTVEFLVGYKEIS